MSEMYRGRWVGEDSTDLPGVVFSAQAGQRTPDLDRPHFSDVPAQGGRIPHSACGVASGTGTHSYPRFSAGPLCPHKQVGKFSPLSSVNITTAVHA